MIVHRSSRSSLSVGAPAARGGGGGGLFNWPPAPVFIIADGDSITAGLGVASPYLALAVAALPAGYGTNANLGISGEQLATMLSNLQGGAGPAPDIATAIAAGQKPIVSIFGGTNDLHGDPSTEPTVVGYLPTYVAKCFALGAYAVIVGTMLPRGDSPSIESARLSFNSTCRSNFASWGSKVVLCDFGGDVSMGTAANVANATLYQTDQIHPTQFGQQILENQFLPTLMSIDTRGSCSSISPATGAHAGGASVTITANVGTVSQVIIGGIQAASFSQAGNTITATTGVAFGTGVADVAVLGTLGAGILAGGWTWT